MRELKPYRVSHGTADVYSFEFEQGGWANFTVNNATGEFSLQCDWGSFAYRWNVQYLGKGPDGKPLTLRDFLQRSLRSDADYVVRKFAYDSHALKDVISETATRKALKRCIAESCREGDLHIGKFLDALGEIDDIDYSDYDSCGHSIANSGYLTSALGGDWYELIETESPFVYKLLREQLLPVFGEHLAGAAA